MCLICAEWDAKRLTIDEAYKNLRETYDESDGHSVEVWLKLLNAEIEVERESADVN